MIEHWDLYDEQLNTTGKTITKFEEIPDGFYHLAVEVWIVNKKKEVLILRNAIDYALLYPDTWCCIGGNLLSKEKVEDAIKRITKDKIGIEINTEDIIINEPVKRDPHKYAYITCIVFEDINLKNIKLKDSYIEAKYVDQKELIKMCNNGEIAYYLIERINKEISNYLK